MCARSGARPWHGGKYSHRFRRKENKMVETKCDTCGNIRLRRQRTNSNGGFYRFCSVACRFQATASHLNPEVFRSKLISRDSGCLEWGGAITRHGYGQSYLAGEKKIQAHRLAWIHAHGEIPEGLWILHHCDNRRCCNVEHLYAGTAQNNSDDMVRRGRNRKTLQTLKVKFP